MPTAKSKKRKSKKEVQEGEEQGDGRRRRSADLTAPRGSAPLSLCSSTVAVEVEMEDRTARSPSREPLTPEPQELAPQKKKKKKRATTIGSLRPTLHRQTAEAPDERRNRINMRFC